MQNIPRKIQVFTAEDLNSGHQITYETDSSRRVINTPRVCKTKETPPHGAGSFHDPEHHFELLDRVDALLRTKA